MKTLRLILGDQLSESISSLADIDIHSDVVLMCEVMDEATYVKHHKKKIAFLFAAMRHFADLLISRGINVRYVRLDDRHNSNSFSGEIARAVKDVNPDCVVVTEPGEYRVLQMFEEWKKTLELPFEVRPDVRFFCSIDSFKEWAHGQSEPRMEYFYRQMRKRTSILMEPDGGPAGGKWNFDRQNRKSLKPGMSGPLRPSHERTNHLTDVLKLVDERFGDHFGSLEPFNFGVTREQALVDLHHFIDVILPSFGDYQDAMGFGEPFLYHSVISPYLNCGLLLPAEVCELAEAAYRSGHAPINAVEGFIRQILGWREFVRGIYWTHMPEYATRNALGADNPLPWFYWSGNTQMRCISEVVKQTAENAYSHHIQRLMVTGNFALLAGIKPSEVNDWYLAVYADAYEWVELPNTHGMALFADGGIMGSKPYAASGKYINRMSNFCGGCRYNPNLTEGENACPFNALYWDFLVRNEDRLRHNQRLSFAYKSWDRFDSLRKKGIRKQAKETLARLREGEL